MRVLADYYALLGVDRRATAAHIEERLRLEQRNWQKRTNNPDLSRRQEAERVVQSLSEARRVLLDERLRREYDEQFAAQDTVAQASVAHGPVIPSQGAPSSEQGDWVERAEDFYARQDYLSAVYAAQEACSADDRSVAAWSVLARSTVELGRIPDALSAARKAITLEPGSGRLYIQLGLIFERQDEWDEAIAVYRNAQRVAPGFHEARFCEALCLAVSDRPEQAMPILEELLATGEDRERVSNVLAHALRLSAERIVQFKTDTELHITSPDEITRMWPYIQRARQVATDPRLQAELAGVEQNLHWCAATHFHRTFSYFMPLVVLAVGYLIAMVITGFTDSEPIGIVALVAAGGWIGVRIHRSYRPGWMINRIALQQQTRQP